LRDGLLPIVVTLAGWIILLRGIVMLALPHQDIAALLNAVHYASFFYVYVAVAFIIGAYLTIAGFRRT
jgi:hypothetical protein